MNTTRIKEIPTRDIMAALELNPPLNESDSFGTNVCAWVASCRRLELFKPDEHMPDLAYWPSQLKNKFVKL